MSSRVAILGVPFDAVTTAGALARVEALMNGGRQAFIATPNPEMLVEARRNHPFLETLQSAALSIPDGTGILWAAHTLAAKLPPWGLRRLYFFASLFAPVFAPARVRQTLPERVTGTDLMQQIVGLSAQRGWKLFLLGAREGVAEDAARALQLRYPGCSIVGTYVGSPADADADAIAARVNAAAPDILFVAYGSPAQELWIQKHLSRFPSVRVAMGVGGAFDFVAGRVRRAPLFMRAAGLEWLWRLICEPRRLGRIFRAVFVFPRLVFGEKLAKRQ